MGSVCSVSWWFSFGVSFGGTIVTSSLEFTGGLALFFAGRSVGAVPEPCTSKSVYVTHVVDSLVLLYIWRSQYGFSA